MFRWILAFLMISIAGQGRVAGDDPGIVAVENALIPPYSAKDRPVSRRRLADRMNQLRVPAVSLAIVRNFELRAVKAYGVADLAERRAASPETRFQAASLSKPVTAATALALVKGGVLALDTDVNPVLKTWKIPDNDRNAARKVTLRRLLSHSGGLSVEGFPGYADGHPLPELLQILEGQPPANNPAVRSELWPGLQYKYSGGGYEVVELLITEKTGRPFPEVVSKYVLHPARMKDSGYAYPRGPMTASAGTGYDGEGKPIAGRYYHYPELAAAGLWTTAGDYARFGLELQKSLNGRTGALLPQALVREMLTEQTKPGGLGFVLRSGERHWFLHTGMNAGFQSIALFSEDGDGAVILTNSDTGTILADEIVATLASAYGWREFLPEQRPAVSLSASALKQYEGSYPTTRFGTIYVEALSDRLRIRSQSRPAVEFFPESASMFFPETPGLKARFMRGWFGGVNAIGFGKMAVRRAGNLPQQTAATPARIN